MRIRPMLASTLLLGSALLFAGSCGTPRPPGAREPNPLEAPPVDTSKVSSADEALAWGLKRETTADLDGDGAEEHIVLACDVTLRGGVPLWEDGHRWALVIASARGDKTLAYAAFVPRGFVEAALLRAGQDRTRRLLVQERTPEQLRSLEIEYRGPGAARSASAAYYQVDHWLPGSATPSE